MAAILKAIDWENADIRAATKKTLQRISRAQHNSKIRYIVLFGSEARGEARLTSDVDLALISDEPLTMEERLAFKAVIDSEHFPPYNVINTLYRDLDTEHVMDVNFHIKRDGLVIYER